MKLQKFGKLMKHQYGSIGGELLNALYEFYEDNIDAFEERFTVLEEVGTKGCFLYKDEHTPKSFIIFGLKYVDKKADTISIKGRIMARGENCNLKVGDEFIPSEDFPINKCIMLDSAGLITSVSDLNLITTEDDNIENAQLD